MKHAHRSLVLLGLLCLLVRASAAAEGPLPSDLPQGGLAVVLGIDDVPFLVELGAKGQRPVHVLSDPVKVQTIRDELRQVGQLGPIQVEGWSAAVLPYADHLARVVVVGDGCTRPEELRRITAPFGVRLLRSGKTWRAERETLFEGMDEWTHSWHDAGRSRLSADRISGPPQALQWQAGPIYQQAVAVAGSGVVVGYEQLTGKTEVAVVVRDAASGVLRWRNRVALAGGRGANLGFVNGWFNGESTNGQNESAIIAGTRLYLATMPRPLVFNLENGTQVGELATAGPVRRLAVQSGKVLAASRTKLETFDAATLAAGWSAPGLANDLTVTPAGLVVFTDTTKTPYDLVALKLADGTPAWRVGLAPYWDEQAVVKPGKGGVIEAQVRIVLSTVNLLLLRGSRGGGELIALDPGSGKERWRGQHAPFLAKDERGTEKKMEGAIPSLNQIALGGGRLWYSVGGQPPARVALDPASGARVGYVRYTGVNDFCQWAMGSPRWVSFKDCVWLDAQKITGVLKADGGSTWNPDGSLKPDGFSAGNGRCGWQAIIAYGQSYFGPKDCNCSTNGAALRAAVGCDQIPAAQRDDGKIGLVEAGTGTPGPTLTGWCQYGADPRRSFAVPASLSSPLVERWRTALKPVPESEWTTWNCDQSRISQPVVAGDQVWVTDTEAGDAICLSLADGKERFRCTAGARMDGPPSLIGGLAVAGSHDGWLYAWSTADGRLVRRTRLAAGERRIVIQGRVESPWSVVGPVLVDNGRAFAHVGRHQRMFEQVHSNAVDLTDGKLSWCKVERCLAGMLALDQGILAPCFGLGADGWWGESMQRIGRDPATGAPVKGGLPLSSLVARSHLLPRFYRTGPIGAGPFVCADNGESVAWFDVEGRELRVNPRPTFAPRMKGSGSFEFLNARDVLKAATWKVPMPEGEVAAAVALAGDALVYATNRWTMPAKGAEPVAPGPGHLLVLSLADGKERQRVELPQAVVHQGLAVHDGGIAVSCRDGLVLRFGK